jgi:hypothetical protein
MLPYIGNPPHGLPEQLCCFVRHLALRHVAPLGWEHIGLTGDYVWSTAELPAADMLRPLRQRQSLLAA